MAETTLHPDPQAFPPGSKVKVYPRAEPDFPNLSGKPAGSEVEEATVAASGALVVKGLTADAAYIGWRESGGTDYYLRFRGPPASTGGGGGEPTGAAGGDLEGEYPNPTIGAGKVIAAGIGAEAVTEAKIKALAVTAAKLAAEAVTNAKLATDAVTNAKVKEKTLEKDRLTAKAIEELAGAGGAPTGAAGGDLAGEYPNPTIGGEKVTTAAVKALAITAAKLAAESVEAGKIATDAVTEAKLKEGAVTAAKIGTDAVTEAKIKEGAVVAAKIGTDAVTEAKIKEGAVAAAKLASEAVETAKIKALAVTAAKLAAEAVETAKIKDEAVTEAKLASAIKPKLTWENVESLSAKLAAEGGEYPGTLQCSVGADGVVRLSGVIKVSEEAAANTVLFTLPVACRPEKQKVFLMTALGSTATFPILVKTNGQVELKSTSMKVAASPVGMDGLNFRKTG